MKNPRLDTLRKSSFAVALSFVCLCAEARPDAGDIPPAHVGTTLDGTPVLLTDYPDRAIVISYWATWCSFCLQEMDILDALQKVAGDHVKVITVNIESEDVFRKALRVLKPIKVLFAYDPDKRGRDAYGVEGIPHMVIVGKDGRIDSVHIGYSEKDLERVVESINRAIGPVQ